MKKLILILFVIGIAAVIYFWKFQYNKKHIDVKTAKADMNISAMEMLSDARNEKSTPIDFNKKYLTEDGKGKIVNIKGAIDKLELRDSVSNVIFGTDSSGYIVSIEMLNEENPKVKSLKIGQIIDIQALFVGLLEPDEMMELPGTILLKKGSIYTEDKKSN